MGSGFESLLPLQGKAHLHGPAVRRASSCSAPRASAFLAEGPRRFRDVSALLRGLIHGPRLKLLDRHKQ